MAEGNLRQYLLNRNEFKRKKYLYVIRPILACRWIEQFIGFPPTEIDKTLPALEGHLIKKTIDALIMDKKLGGELGVGPADKALEAFLVEEIERIKKSVVALPDHGQNMSELNKYFRTVFREKLVLTEALNS